MAMARTPMGKASTPPPGTLRPAIQLAAPLVSFTAPANPWNAGAAHLEVGDDDRRDGEEGEATKETGPRSLGRPPSR
jgi:hypothetical protein